MIYCIQCSYEADTDTCVPHNVDTGHTQFTHEVEIATQERATASGP